LELVWRIQEETGGERMKELTKAQVLSHERAAQAIEHALKRYEDATGLRVCSIHLDTNLDPPRIYIGSEEEES